MAHGKAMLIVSAKLLNSKRYISANVLALEQCLYCFEVLYNGKGTVFGIFHLREEGRVLKGMVSIKVIIRYSLCGGLS